MPIPTNSTTGHNIRFFILFPLIRIQFKFTRELYFHGAAKSSDFTQKSFLWHQPISLRTLKAVGGGPLLIRSERYMALNPAIRADPTG